MGEERRAICNACRHRFSMNIGGGFRFHLLRCDRCGAEKAIGFDSLGDIHLRYLKGLQGPYSVATADYDREVQRNYPGEPLPEGDYESKVEEFAGKCGCGGEYKFNAPPRCPKCKSSDLKMGKVLLCYD